MLWGECFSWSHWEEMRGPEHEQVTSWNIYELISTSTYETAKETIEGFVGRVAPGNRLWKI